MNPGLIVLFAIILIGVIVTVISAYIEPKLPMQYRGYEIHPHPTNANRVAIYYWKEYIDSSDSVTSAKALIDHWLVGQ